MLWFQKVSLDTVGFRTFRTFRGGGGSVLLKTIVTIVDFVDQIKFWIPKCTEGGRGGDLGNFPKFYQFF